MGIIDSHAHVFDTSEIREINSNSDIEHVINIGMNATTSSQVIEIAQTNPKFYAACGVHPLYVYRNNNGNITHGRINKIFELATSNKVVAIGEIGLDYSSKIPINYQKWAFIEQIKIANALGLPVIIHSNGANKKILNIFDTIIKPEHGCVFHCFQPNLDDLAKIMKNGYYISFAGRITYPNADESLKVAKSVDEDKFLVETDSPYIAPVPFKGEPGKVKYITYTVDKLAEVRETTPQEIARITNENTKRLFKRLK